MVSVVTQRPVGGRPAVGDRLRAELLKVAWYRAPLAYALAATTISLLWAGAFGWHLGADPTVSTTRMHAAVTSGFTQFGCWLLSLATAVLVSADATAGFAGPRTALPGQWTWIAAKVLAGTLVGLAVAAVVWVGCLGCLIMLAGTGGAVTVSADLMPILPRMLVATTLSVITGAAWTVLLGYRHRLTILAVLVWPVVLERILSAIAPGDLGAYLAPFRSLAYYVSGYGVGLPYPYPSGEGWRELAVFTVLLGGGAALAHRVRTRRPQ